MITRDGFVITIRPIRDVNLTSRRSLFKKMQRVYRVSIKLSDGSRIDVYSESKEDAEFAFRLLKNQGSSPLNSRVFPDIRITR